MKVSGSRSEACPLIKQVILPVIGMDDPVSGRATLATEVKGVAL